MDREITEKSTAAAGNKTIVFIDNDLLILEAIREILVSKGYVVHTAQDGLEGISLVRKVKPDYIILDIVMPKLDGGHVCAEVRKDARLRRTPIIVFSSLTPKEYRYFPQLGADAYVAKGQFESAAENILKVIRHFEEGGLETLPGQGVGFEEFRTKRMDNELLQERAHLAAIVRAITPGALELDTMGRIVMANPGAYEILGKSATSLVGKLFSTLVAPFERPVVRELVAELVQSVEPTQHVASFRVEDLRVSARLSPILEDCRCTGLLVILEKVA